jgi:hypothetical protein
MNGAGGDMLVETINKVEELVTKGQRAQLLPCPAMPKDRVLIEKRPGEVEGYDIPRGAVVDRAFGLAGLCAQVLTAGEGAAGVYVGHDKIRVVWDEDRRDSIEMALPWSEPFALLAKPEALAGLTQRDLIWLLRSTFKGAFAPPELLPTVRSVKFTSAGQAESDIQHGRESLGRKVDAEITGAGAIPEEVIFRVPVYSDMVDDAGNHFTASVACALDIDLEKQRFTLKPLPDEVAVAKREANAWICERIALACPGAVVYPASAAG